MKYLILLIATFFMSNAYAQETNAVRYNTEHKTTSEKSTIVTGRVIHDDIEHPKNGQPIDGAIISFEDIGNSIPDIDKELLYITTSDKDGFFKIKVPYGKYTVHSEYTGLFVWYEFITLRKRKLKLEDVRMNCKIAARSGPSEFLTIKRRDRKK